MRARPNVQAVLVALLAVALGAAAAASEVESRAADPISGEWQAAFELAGGSPFTRTLKLTLEGTRVSGSAGSSRGDDGTITGSWEAGELNLAIESERGTMALSGALKQGRLTGDWDVGHARGSWTAKKRSSP